MSPWNNTSAPKNSSGHWGPIVTLSPGTLPHSHSQLGQHDLSIPEYYENQDGWGSSAMQMKLHSNCNCLWFFFLWSTSHPVEMRKIWAEIAIKCFGPRVFNTHTKKGKTVPGTNLANVACFLPLRKHPASDPRKLQFLAPAGGDPGCVNCPVHRVSFMRQRKLVHISEGLPGAPN